MEGINPNIFRAYDIRGLWGKDFDAAFAQRLASKVVAYWPDGPIIIGRDSRASSDELAYALIDGALHVGTRVIDIGHVSTPQLAWAIREYKAAGGLMATASHNPGEYNGIKVIARQGEGLELIGGHHLRQIYDSHGHSHHRDGTVQVQDIIPAYARVVASTANWHGQELTASIDAPLPVRRALELITPIAPDDGFAAKFDADGDRVTFFQDGLLFAAEWIFLLLADNLVLKPLVFDLRFSRAVREYLIARNIPFHESAVGRLAMTENMRATGAVFGAETSGHYYWQSFANMESPELTLLNVARIINQKHQSLDELTRLYARYVKSDEISLPIKDRKASINALEHVATKYQTANIKRIDGIMVDLWDSEGWWFNLRLSNTEPVLRLVVEAKTKDLLDERAKEVQEFLRG